ncbi:MAG: DEAD/DEAH box helicase, partial [Planctomycetes bacterium]|nr:DEAD/DEAH box helicase [Planctomycetota bacterium]
MTQATGSGAQGLEAPPAPSSAAPAQAQVEAQGPARAQTQPPGQAPGQARFDDYHLAPDVLEALRGLGIEKPTPIQEACIPAILEGRDVVGKAETGTGKTIGFGAPLVGRIDTNRVAVQALVLTPTRELAQQVAGVLEVLGKGRGLGVALVVGGVHASEQVLKLRSGSQVVVGTPGRVLDFLRDRTLSLVWCEVAVLDEADRMLDMGFIDDVTAILDKVPPERQTLLFSATVPPEVQRLLKRYMKDPAMFSTSSRGLATVAEITQRYVEADFRDKFRTLARILDARSGSTAIIFCNTRRQAIDLDRMLWGHGYCAGALHGEQEQDVRFRILDSFRKGDTRILVATDVASRGLDIPDVGCIINYEVPEDAESYVHRIGRTGRAQKSGEAVTIVARKERGLWQRILRQTGFPIERLGAGRGRSVTGNGVVSKVNPQQGGARFVDQDLPGDDMAAVGPGGAEPAAQGGGHE